MRRHVLVLAAVLSIAAACASSRGSATSRPRTSGGTSAATGPATTTTTGAAATSTTANPAPALVEYLAGIPLVVSGTGPVPVGATVIAVAARQLSPTDREVDVLSWSGTAWATTAALTLPYPWYGLSDLPVQVADVTGDGLPDFLVRVDAADNQPGVVVSDDGGLWRLVPLATGGTPGPDDVYAGRNPSFQDGHLTTQYNDCSPDCAQGTTTTVVWDYDRPTERFVRVGQ